MLASVDVSISVAFGVIYKKKSSIIYRSVWIKVIINLKLCNLCLWNLIECYLMQFN